MNKSELIDRIAEKAQTSKAAAGRAVDAIFDAGSGAIAEAIRAGQNVSIPGFGKFRSKQRAARKGRNPQTGTAIQIPESTVVSFTPGKSLKDVAAGKPVARKKAPARATAKGSSRTASAPKAGSTSRSRASTAKTTAERQTGGTSKTGGAKGGTRSGTAGATGGKKAAGRSTTKGKGTAK